MRDLGVGARGVGARRGGWSGGSPGGGGGVEGVKGAAEVLWGWEMSDSPCLTIGLHRDLFVGHACPCWEKGGGGGGGGGG